MKHWSLGEALYFWASSEHSKKGTFYCRCFAQPSSVLNMMEKQIAKYGLILYHTFYKMLDPTVLRTSYLEDLILKICYLFSRCINKSAEEPLNDSLL